MLNLCADRHFYDIHCQRAKKAGKLIRGSKRKTRELVHTLRQMSPPAAGGRGMCHSNRKRRQGECKMKLDVSAPFLCTALGSRAKLGARRGMRCRIEILPLVPKESPWKFAVLWEPEGGVLSIQEIPLYRNKLHPKSLEDSLCFLGFKFSWSCFMVFHLFRSIF